MKPDNDYLSKLGLAHYAIQGTTWSVVYALHYTTGEGVGDLAVLAQRTLAKKLKKVGPARFLGMDGGVNHVSNRPRAA